MKMNKYDFLIFPPWADEVDAIAREMIAFLQEKREFSSTVDAALTIEMSFFFSWHDIVCRAELN